MPKPKAKKAISTAKRTPATAGLRAALNRRSNAELVSVLVELAQADRGVFRQLVARFNVSTAPTDLVAATRRAISDATDFDDRDINTNFDYDYEAYEELKRNLGRLIASGNLRQAMELSLELMKEGSYQVEMSDEGLMADDIEACLSVVLRALNKCDLPPAEITAWCSAMLKNDRLGCIAREPIQSLQNQAKAASGPIPSRKAPKRRYGRKPGLPERPA